MPTENLDEADREMIAVVVSAWNRYLYCLVAHGHALRVALGDPVLGDCIASTGGTPASTSGAPHLRVRREAHRVPARDDRGRPAGLRDVGLTDEEVWDVAEIAAMYNFTNRMALALDQRPERGVPPARPVT